jgi:hypothetical protein
MGLQSVARLASRRRRALALGLLACAPATLGASAIAERSAGPHLHASPARVERGGTVVLHGRGFPANVHVVLRATPPGKRSVRIGEAHTGRRGGFVAPVAIDARAALGRYVAAACHDRCRVKATVVFRVLRP